MGWKQGPVAPLDMPPFAAPSCSSRRKRRASIVFEVVATITRGFDHVLAAALGECHHVETSPQLDTDNTQSLERIHGWLLESSSTARRLRALIDTPAVCRVAPEEAADLDATLREFVTVVRPLCRADGRRRGVHIRILTHFGSRAFVHSSGERLRELATGLLTQAIDALHAGGVVHVESGDAPYGPWLEVRYSEPLPHAPSTTLRVRLHRLAPVVPYSEPAARFPSLRATSTS